MPDVPMLTLQGAASTSEVAQGQGLKRQHSGDDDQTKRMKYTPQDEEMSPPADGGGGN